MNPPVHFPTSSPHPAGFYQVSPAEVRDQVRSLRRIDVRELDEFTGPLGRISGAELVPVGVVATAALPWDRHQPLLLICRSGARSGRAAAALAGLGFTEVYNLVGGMLMWNELGLPVETGPVPPSRLNPPSGGR